MTATMAPLLLGALAGAGFGAVYLGLLWGAVRALPRDRGGVFAFVALGLARAALLVGALSAAATLGLPAGAVVAAVAGFIVVRFAATRRRGSGTPGGAPWR
jgi:hypothetical protein